MLNKQNMFSELAEKYDFCGREIRKAVVSACVKSAMRGKGDVDMAMFSEACEQIKREESSIKGAVPAPLNINISNSTKANE